MKDEIKLPFIDGLQDKDFPKERAENIQHIRDWLSFQPHLPKLTDEHLHNFLHSCFDNLEKTKKTIDSYFTMKTMSPELFSERNPLGDDVQLALDTSEMVLLPRGTPDGTRVVMYRLSNTSASKFACLPLMKTFFMVNDMFISEDGPCPGYISIFDMKGFSLGHLARLSVSLLSKFMFYIQECHPVRLKSIHVLNTVPFMDKLLALIKPFMHSELIQMLHLHGPLDSYEDIVPSDILPEDYGGKAKPVKEIHADLRRMLEGRYVDWFRQEELLKVDEKKRAGSSYVTDNAFGAEGSFKKLAID